MRYYQKDLTTNVIMKKSRLMEMAGLNESTTLQLTPEEHRRLKYTLEQKLNDWKDSPDFWSEAIVAVESILKKMG